MLGSADVSARPASAATRPTTSPVATAGIVVVVAVFLASIGLTMVTDVWDEGRGLNVIAGHSLLELVRTNWQQETAGGVVLFRPVPLLLVTVVAHTLDDFELSWRLLRCLNALLLLAAVAFLVDARRRLGGPDPTRDLLLAAGVLWSGGAVIAGGWFATVFDVTALLAVALGLAALARGRGLRAGAAFAAAFFCKEIAILALPFVAGLRWAGTTPRRASDRAFLVAAAGGVAYGLLRLAVVAPGSSSDVRAFTLSGTLSALWAMPETLWWQLADPPVPLLSFLLTAVVLGTLRPWRLAAGAAGVVVTAALVYGQMVHVRPSPLLDADTFIGRLYILPAALVLLALALGGRRLLLAAVLVPLAWGAVLTADRHIRFQHAYRTVYDLAARTEPPPLVVDSPLYRGSERYHHPARRLLLGAFPDARWHLRLDGQLVDRRSGAVPDPRRPTASPD